MLSSWNSIALFFASSSWVLSPTLRRHWLHDILEYHAVLLESLSTACAAFMISLNACARSSREPQNRLCHTKAAGEREPRRQCSSHGSGKVNERTRSEVDFGGTSIGLSPSAEDQTVSFVSKSTSLSGGSRSLMCSEGAGVKHGVR